MNLLPNTRVSSAQAHLRRSRSTHRRAAAVVAMVITMMLMSLIMVGMVMGGARDQDLSLQRMDTIRAFYAAESGINMGTREFMVSADEDGDGAIGTISNDGNSANNPVIGMATVSVSSANSGGITTLTSVGTKGATVRNVATDFQLGSGNMGYTTAFGSDQDNVDDMQVATQVTLASTTTVTRITAYVHGPPPKLMRFALYSDSGGEPGSLLAQSYTEAVGSNSFHWHTLYIPSTTLSAGTYWLALAFAHRNVSYAFTGTGGQTRWNGNDGVGSGFQSTWSSTTSSNTQKVSIYTDGMSPPAGPMTFSSNTTYDNTNPPNTGLFRDITNPTMIQRGSDISSNSTHYNALNFTTASGLVSDCLTAYDTDPTTSAQTNLTGTLRITADVLYTGSGSTRYIALGALHNEVSGQGGIALVLTEGSGDRLRVFRMPTNGDISGASHLVQSGTFSGLSANSWFRLVMDVDVTGGTLTVDGRIFSHTTANNPNSAVNADPMQTINYSAAISGLSGLQSTGEVCLAFDTTSSTSRCSMTNVRIDSGTGGSASTTVTSWAEIPTP